MTKGKGDRGRQSIVEQEFFTEETSRETKEDKKETAKAKWLNTQNHGGTRSSTQETRGETTKTERGVFKAEKLGRKGSLY